MNPIEQAYKAWRATLVGNDVTATRVIVRLIRQLAPAHPRAIRTLQQVSPTVTAKPRKYAGTGRYKRTAAHKEASRKAALRRWAKARRRA